LVDNNNIEEENKVNNEEPKMTSEELEKLNKQIILTVMGDEGAKDISVKEIEDTLGNHELSRILADNTLDTSKKEELVNEQTKAYLQKAFGNSKLTEITSDNIKDVFMNSYIEYHVSSIFEESNEKINMKVKDYMLIKRMKKSILYMCLYVLITRMYDEATTFLLITAVLVFAYALSSIKDSLLRIKELEGNN
jgi:hypothetical protein